MSSIQDESFLNHRPQAGGIDEQKMVRLRAEALRFKQTLEAFVPSSAEQTLAIRKLEESLMWGNKAIVLHPEGPVETDTTPLNGTAGYLDPEESLILQQPHPMNLGAVERGEFLGNPELPPQKHETHKLSVDEMPSFRHEVRE